MAEEKRKERPSALRSIIAGSTAGAVEIGMFVFCFFVFWGCCLSFCLPFRWGVWLETLETWELEEELERFEKRVSTRRELLRGFLRELLLFERGLWLIVLRA
jgi:hypothetical protein